MRTHAVDHHPRPPELISRRAFLQAIGFASACRFRPAAAGFTALGDEIVALLMRWCACTAAPRFAAG